MIDREWGKSSEKERETRKTRKKDTEEEAKESQCCCISKDSGPREGFEVASGTSATFWRPPTLLPKGALPGAS